VGEQCERFRPAVVISEMQHGTPSDGFRVRGTR
jgi:hypothetical protein